MELLEEFLVKKLGLESDLIDYVYNDRHDHHQGYMHRRYAEFFDVIGKYKDLLFSDECPHKGDAKKEIKRFLETELIERLKEKDCEHCRAIANLIQVECVPK